MARCSWPTNWHQGATFKSFRCVLTLAILLLLSTPYSYSQPAQTLEADVTALANIFDGISNSDKTVIQTWADPTTDPCTDGWPGVICNCSQLPATWVPACASTMEPSGRSRVVGLDLGATVTASEEPLMGTISPDIGDLDKLIYLNFAQNQLR